MRDEPTTNNLSCNVLTPTIIRVFAWVCVISSNDHGGLITNNRADAAGKCDWDDNTSIAPIFPTSLGTNVQGSTLTFCLRSRRNQTTDALVNLWGFWSTLPVVTSLRTKTECRKVFINEFSNRSMHEHGRTVEDHCSTFGQESFCLFRRT